MHTRIHFHPLSSRSRNAGALYGYRIAGFLPSPLSLLFTNSSLYQSSSISLLPFTLVPHLAVSFRPFRPQITPLFHPTLPPAADTEGAYACVHVVTTYYYVLLLPLAYYYRQWRAAVRSPRPSSLLFKTESTEISFEKIFGRTRHTSPVAIYGALFPLHFRCELIPLSPRCSSNFEAELLGASISRNIKKEI